MELGAETLRDFTLLDVLDEALEVLRAGDAVIDHRGSTSASLKGEWEDSAVRCPIGGGVRLN
jgi:hypothetical protein